MWHYVRALVVPAVLIATSAEAQPAPDTRRFDEAVELKPATSFGEQTTLRGTGGTPKRVTLTIRNWIIQNRQRIPVFPEQGLLVIQIRAGSLTTIINGQRQDRGPDDFWTVPSGTTMAIETGEDSVILQVVSLREP